MDKKGRDTAPFMIERRIRMSGQILFTDLDDTLLNDRKEVTPGSRRAIEAALAKRSLASKPTMMTTIRP